MRDYAFFIKFGKFKLRAAYLLAALGLVLSGCNSPNGPSEITCGGLVGFICPATMYCKFSEHCGGVDGEGVCKPRPLSCPNQISEFCGCDDKTYSSECYAALRGVSVKRPGQCE